MERKNAHCLIVASVNQGYSDLVVKTANSAGARGGTVLLGRKVDYEDSSEVLNLPIQSEREIILLLVETEVSAGIMTAIDESFGVSSEAQGMVFSLPVENVVGLVDGNIN